MRMHQVLLQIGQNCLRNLLHVNTAFRVEAVRHTVGFDCFVESKNGVQSVEDAECSGCLPASRTIEQVKGFLIKIDVLISIIWLMS